MDKLFLRLVEQHTPKMTKSVVEGLACQHMKKTEEYIDRVFKLVAKTFPLGLTYDGYERCTPHEEFEETTKIKNNQRTFDLAPSYIYLVKYKFSFKGEKLPDRYIHLPYVEDAGIISLGGARFHVTPVLSDKVISAGPDSIFVRTLQKKHIFKRIWHSIVIDNKKETTHVVWSQIKKSGTTTDKNIPATTRASTCLAHYLFAKHGFDETFRRYAGFIPVAGGDEINSESYPDTDWIICQSEYEKSQIKPKTFLGEFYKGTNIRLAIRKDKWCDMTKALVVGFYYVIDHFPNRFKPQSDYLNNTNLWKILMGHILHSGVYGEDKLHTLVTTHFDSLDNCLDEIAIEKLKERGYIIQNPFDFYDLLALLMNNFNNLILDSENTRSSMYGKNMEVLYYVLYDITSGIIKAMFNLRTLANKRELVAKDIVDMCKKNLRTGAIFELSSGKIITESISYSGDHKYIKLTSKMTEQESLPGATRAKSKHASVGENMRFHISMIEGGSFLYLAKRSPTPTNRVNPYVTIEPATGTIVPNPKFNEVRELTEDLINGKIYYDRRSKNG